MTTPLVGSNVKVEVQATLATALTVSAITKASPGVVSYTGTDPANGDVVVMGISDGMVELDKFAVRVANVNTGGNTFELEGVDTTNFSTFTAGTATPVATWATYAAAQQFSCPNQPPTKLDATTLIDKRKKVVFGLPEAPDGSISGLFNPGGAAEGYVKAATRSNALIAFRVTWAAGQKTIFAGYVSGGEGFDANTNAIVTATAQFSPQGEILHYAS